MTLPEEFWLAVGQFERGEFYACHDTLEALWIEADLDEKGFYQGLLQIAVALYHLGNGNGQGAMILLGEGIHRLKRYDDDYGGIALDRFRNQSAALLHALQQAGPEGVGPVARSLGLGESLGESWGESLSPAGASARPQLQRL